MLVVGATYPEELKRIRELVGNMTILVPGMGTQGGDLGKTLDAGLTGKKQGLIINASRSVIFSQEPRKVDLQMRDEINQYIQKNHRKMDSTIKD